MARRMVWAVLAAATAAMVLVPASPAAAAKTIGAPQVSLPATVVRGGTPQPVATILVPATEGVLFGLTLSSDDLTAGKSHSCTTTTGVGCTYLADLGLYVVGSDGDTSTDEPVTVVIGASVAAKRSTPLASVEGDSGPSRTATLTATISSSLGDVEGTGTTRVVVDPATEARVRMESLTHPQSGSVVVRGPDAYITFGVNLFRTGNLDQVTAVHLETYALNDFWGTEVVQPGNADVTFDPGDWVDSVVFEIRVPESAVAGKTLIFFVGGTYGPAVDHPARDSVTTLQRRFTIGSPPVQPADFDGNGTSTPAVFRPSTGRWHLHGSPTAIAFGAAGDIPVPGQWDSTPSADLAVYRPSTGRWYRRGEGPTTVDLGVLSGTPVPADFDGDGLLEIAAFRPATGRWHTAGGPAAGIAWGTAGDVPVPADYDGDGDADIAVFRPSSGRWFIRGVAGSVQFGANGDIPVPGQWDNDPSADLAVFRPSNGRWYVEGWASSYAWGTAGDVPVPGNWDAGNPALDIAVYRPSNGRWYLNEVGTVSWGTSGDVQLLLPHANRP